MPYHQSCVDDFDNLAVALRLVWLARIISSAEASTLASIYTMSFASH